WLPFVPIDDRVAREYQPGAGSREAREDEPGHHRQEAHARKDLDRGDDMGIGRLRMHIAKTDRRQRLHAEEKEVNETARPGVCNWIVAYHVGQREATVEGEKNDCCVGEKLGPGNLHGAVVEVTERPPAFLLSEGVPAIDVNRSKPLSCGERNFVNHTILSID